MRDHLTFDHPLDALVQGGALAVITAATGGYRMPGAMMAVTPSGCRIGDLTSGCIEADVVLHAKAAMEDGRKRTLVYGEGSPFTDLRLPCGGMLEVTILPDPDTAILAEANRLRRSRTPFTLWLADNLQLCPGGFPIPMRPDPRFVVLGTGTEAETFATTVRGAGYASMDDMSDVDAHTAIALFFHDHDREIPLLLQALRTNAFYIGAQGSQRAAAARADALLAQGADADAVARIRGPIGLIQRARDPRILAVSVLAEVLASL